MAYMRALMAVVLAVLLTGCSVGQMMARTSTAIMDGGVVAMNREADLKLAEAAIPANLKLIEGLIQEDPDNPTLREYAAQALYGYAYGFVEDADPARAGALYLRCLEHADHALRQSGLAGGVRATPLDTLESALADLPAGHVPVLFWSASCLAKWIDMRRNDPAALAELGKAKALMGRVLALDETFYYGGPHLFFGVYYGGLSPMLGGDPERARTHFARAEAITGGRLLVGPVLYAQFLARQELDQKTFHDKLSAVLAAPDDLLPEMTLANAIAKDKARRLLAQESAWF